MPTAKPLIELSLSVIVAEDGRFCSHHGIDLTEITVDDQVITKGLCEVYFRPLGASSYHCVHLSQPLLEREYTLESLPLTGEIRLHDGNYKRDPVDEGDFR